MVKTLFITSIGVLTAIGLAVGAVSTQKTPDQVRIEIREVTRPSAKGSLSSPNASTVSPHRDVAEGKHALLEHDTASLHNPELRTREPRKKGPPHLRHAELRGSEPRKKGPPHLRHAELRGSEPRKKGPPHLRDREHSCPQSAESRHQHHDFRALVPDRHTPSQHKLEVEAPKLLPLPIQSDPVKPYTGLVIDARA